MNLTSEFRQFALQQQTRRAFLGRASQGVGALALSPWLNRLAHLAVPFLADWCVVDVLEDDGSIRRVAIAYADPEQAEALFLRVLAEAKFQPTKDERLRAYAAQHTVMEAANDICRLALRTRMLSGGRDIRLPAGASGMSPAASSVCNLLSYCPRT